MGDRKEPTPAPDRACKPPPPPAPNCISLRTEAEHVADTIRAFLLSETVEAKGIATDSIIGHLGNAIQIAMFLNVRPSQNQNNSRLIARLEAVHRVLLRAANRGEHVVGLVDDVRCDNEVRP